MPHTTKLGGFAPPTSFRQIRDTDNIRRKIRLGGEHIWLNDLRFNNCGLAGYRFDGCKEGAAGISDLPPAVVSDNIAAEKMLRSGARAARRFMRSDQSAPLDIKMATDLVTSACVARPPGYPARTFNVVI